jgi:imidazolonepropionase-like amidohydrolase
MSRLIRWAAVSALGGLWVASTAVGASAPPSEPTALHAARLVDVLSGQLLNDAWVVVDGARITAVGTRAVVPAQARVIELGDRTLVPGLIDCHTHVADMPDVADPFETLRYSPAEIAYAAIPNARATLQAGFTTVRDVGTYRAFNDVALRDAIAKGLVEGPRMYVAGAYLTITGGAGAMTGLANDIPMPASLHYGEANGPWEVRAKVRDLVHHGADHIKLLSTGAVLTHGSNPKSIEFTPEELSAAVQEAANFGLKVAAHAHAVEGIKNAIRAGVASIEHATMIDDEGIALAKAHGTYLDMDIYDEECIQNDPTEPADFLQHDRDLAAAQREAFRKAVKAGVKMSFGTDSGICPHGTNARQFAFMVRYGMTPLQALQAATINAADLIGHADLFGSISVGKSADLIAVPGNPLDDVRRLEQVQFVMKEGRVYRQD